MALKENFTVVFSLAVLFSTCTGVNVTINSLGDVIEGSETKMICNYSPTSGGTFIITWNNVTGGASEEIATTIVGVSKGVQPAYSAIFSLDPNDDRVLVINETLRSYSGDYQCAVTIVAVSTGNDDVTLNVIYFESSNVVMIDVNSETAAHNVLITCSGSIDGNPVPDINLYRDNAMIITQNSLPLTYTIATVSENDGGIYRCEANNTAGSVTSNTIQLDYYKPIFIQYIYTVGSSDKYVIMAGVNANPQDVTYVWSCDDVNDTDTNPATFTFIASSVDVGTVHEISLIASNLIGSTTSKIILIAVSETTVQPRNTNRIYIYIGMLFVGIIIGSFGLYIGQIIHKITKKSLSEKQNADKREQDTYMDYVVDTAGEQNQTYQDLQSRSNEQESTYVNVNAGNKKRRKGKI